MILPAWVGHAAGGLVAGAVLGWMALPFFLSTAHLALGPLLGGAIGATVGVIYGKIAEGRAAMRSEELAENARRIGAQFSERDAEVEQGLRSDFLRQPRAMRNVMRKDLVGLRLWVGDLSITRGGGDDTSTVRQTGAYYRRDDVSFPGFTLQPTGMMTKLLSAGTGMQGLRFPGQPEFESRYFVLATDVNGTRELLNAQVLAWLLAHPGLHVDAAGHSVLVYRERRTLRPDELEGFVSEAAELFRLLARVEVKAVAPLTTQDEVRAFAAQMPPSVAKSLEKQMRAKMVTREDVDAFLRQNPPRRIPSNLAHQYSTGRWLVLIGAVFAALAVVMLPMYALKREWFGAAFVSIFLIAGGAMLFFGGRSWWRQRRVLRNGQLAAAKIERVESANWSDDEGEAFHVSVRYQSHEGRGTVKGRAAERLKALAAEGKMAPILYDPAHPERVVLVDALVNAAS